MTMSGKRFRCGIQALIALSGMLMFGGCLAADEHPMDDLIGLSLEELSNLEVSIVSKRPERLADSAAAVSVLTAEEIRRSGYTSIAELLRLVPGMDVVRVDTGEWAISSRGFNSRFANKLLVMVDGRSVYTSLFSGTFWENLDVVLEDIERIEVIRGPGASTWGANAVNGVINIITRHAGDTEGGLVSAYHGGVQRGLALRYGAPFGDSGFFRVYGKYNARDGFLEQEDFRDDDRHHGGRVGFRADWEPSASDALMLQGEVFDEDPNDPWLGGGHLLFNWENRRDDGAVGNLQMYLDRFDLQTGEVDDDAVNEVLDTLDVEYRHLFAPMGGHELIAGVSYRFQRSVIEQHAFTQSDPAERHSSRFSAFFQDEIALLQDRWYLTIGSKLEYNDYTGFEAQPTLRSRWNPDDHSTLWAAVSRAVRVPSRAEHDLFVEDDLSAGSPMFGGLPVKFAARPDDSFDSEELIAYELGYRWRSSDTFMLDLAMFYNDYDQLRTLEIGNPMLVLEPSPRILVSGQAGNMMQGQTYGFELSTEWRPHPKWRLRANYSLLKMNLDAHPDSLDPTAEDPAGQSPEQQLSLRAMVDIAPDWELDLFLRYVDRLPYFEVDAYTELDARLGWHVNQSLSLALVGRNLLNETHWEYGREPLGSTPHLIEREVFVRLEWRF